ncbi:MAG: hypothetical protein J5996_02385 [Prevotella sp.]|nr:hypothetical protein [Prevotella sp.]
MGKITKGYILQVPSGRNGNPSAQEVETVLKALGFTDRQTLGYASSGNWKVEELK